MKLRLIICFFMFLGLLGFTENGKAENFPNRPITLIMPFGAGNAPDTAARIIAEYLQEKHGVTLLITSKAGGSGIPAMLELSHARPDGYTISLTSANVLTVVPQAKPCGFTYKDFSPISQIANFTMGWGVLASSNIKGVDDLMQKAKEFPKKYSVGSPGALTAQRFFHTQLMKHFPKSNLPYVAYNGGAELVTALLGKHIEVAYTPISNFTPHGDTIKIIAISKAERDPMYPDVPTFAELYDKNLVFDSIYGIVGPKNIPEERIAYLDSLFKEALEDSTVQEKMKKVFVTYEYLPAEKFSEVLKQYNDFFAVPIKEFLNEQKK